MNPLLLAPRNKKTMFLFIVSVDKLFMKKLNQHIVFHSFDVILEIASGDELFKELDQNPLPKHASAIALVDYTLVDRDHPYVKDGLTVLGQLSKKWPSIERVLLLTPSNKAVKNKALQNGIEHVLIKNDNAFVRFDILIKGIVSKLQLSRIRQDFFKLLAFFAIFACVSSALIFGMTLWETMP